MYPQAAVPIKSGQKMDTKILPEFHVFKSRIPHLQTAADNGTLIAFFPGESGVGEHVTKVKGIVDYLTEQTESDHPLIYVDKNDATRTDEQAAPMEALRAKIRKDIIREYGLEGITEGISRAMPNAGSYAPDAASSADTTLAIHNKMNLINDPRPASTVAADKSAGMIVVDAGNDPAPIPATISPESLAQQSALNGSMQDQLQARDKERGEESTEQAKEQAEQRDAALDGLASL